MKIYITNGSSVPQETISQIKTFLTNQGHSFTTRQRMTDFNTINFENAKKAFAVNVKAIKAADIVIAECSYHSNGLGFDVSIALEEKKPVIALYNMTHDRENPRHIQNVPTSLKGNTSRYLLLKEYDSRNLEKTLGMSLKDARGLVDTKFILIIQPFIDRYLEWNSREKGFAKAEVTRQAIERMMLADESYQNYLKTNDMSD